MKKIFCLIAALVLITGCDDGDMSYKTFDFSGIEPVPCTTNNDDPQSSTEIYYKISNTESLVLTLAKGTLENTPTGNGDPQLITLGGANTLIYQNYVTKPTSLCTEAEIPASTETWKGQGTLSVSTYENTVNDKLAGYIHKITLVNVTFKLEGSDETITINNSLFGNVDFDFDFDFDFILPPATAPVVNLCPEGTLLYTFKNSEILSLNVTDFDTVFGNTSGTKTIAIPDTDGVDDATVLFNVYSSNVNQDNACAQGSNVPSLPTQRWQLISGSIDIITTETGGAYKHEIYLKNAVFGSLLNTGDSFELDKVITVGPNGYFFGTF
jgi:hypothetical protein